MSHRCLRALVASLWILTAMMTYHVVLYVWPRTPAVVVEPVPLEKNTYRSGDVVIGFFDVINYIDAITNYERHLKCITDDPNIAQEEIIIRLSGVTDVPVTKSEREVRSAQIAPLPEVGFEGVCYIQIVGYYKVRVAPFIDRTYAVPFRTADFNMRRN